MSDLTITIFGVEHTLKGLDGAAHRAGHLEPVWEDLGADLMKIEAQIFATEGGALGATWPALNPAYARWKARHGFSGRILEKTGALRASLTDESSDDLVLETKPQEMTFGSIRKVGPWFLGEIHQAGRGRVQVRKHFPTEEKDLPASAIPRWLKWIETYVVGEAA